MSQSVSPSVRESVSQSVSQSVSPSVSHSKILLEVGAYKIQHGTVFARNVCPKSLRNDAWGTPGRSRSVFSLFSLLAFFVKNRTFQFFLPGGCPGAKTAFPEMLDGALVEAKRSLFRKTSVSLA